MILWLLWDKLSLVTSVSECFEIIKSPFSYLPGEYTLVVENLKENFGTSYIWQKTMSDIMRHKVVCGHVGAGPGFGRVHIDNACVTFRSSDDVRILSQVTECYDCPLEEVKTLSENGNSSFQVCMFAIFTLFPVLSYSGEYEIPHTPPGEKCVFVWSRMQHNLPL